jgi:hypothetical protein
MNCIWGWKLSWTFSVSRGEWRMADRSCHQVWKSRFEIWPRDTAVVHMMDVPRFTLTQETTAVKVKREDSVDLFVWLQRDSARDYRTINYSFVSPNLDRLGWRVRPMRPEFFPARWTLRHDKAPSHISLSVREFYRPWSWNTPLTHQISLCMSSFLPWKIMSLDLILKPWQRFRILQRQL